MQVAGIVNDSITDGPGLRLAVFLQGCLRKCKGCHNPETQPLEKGTKMSVQSIIDKIKANPLLQGVTFSGGEPMLQAAQLTELAKAVKAQNLELAIYSGYTFDELLAQDNPDITNLLKLADVLVDGEFVLEKRTLALKWRGSTNQRIIDLTETFRQNKIIPKTQNGWK